MLINSTTVKSLDLVDGSKLTFDLATTKKEDVCITTPLFVSEYKNGINLGLVRMLNNNTNVGFGKGTNLNVCYKLAKTNDTTLVLTHPTFEQEQFVLDDDANTFKSTISDRYITKQEESEMYTLCSGNTLFVFDLTGGTSSNIKELHEQNVTFNFVYDSHEKIIEISNNNDLKEKAVFTYNEDENCTSITSSKKMNVDSDTFTQIGKTELIYTNNIVSQVSIKMHNKTAIKRKSIFTATTTQIVVSDGISSITNTIKLAKNSSTNKYYVTEVDVDNQKLLVTYNDYKTTLLLKVNKTTNDEVEVNKEEYFFNKNYELSFIKANDRIVKAFNYELNERHRLLSISKELFMEPELNGDYVLPSSYIQQDYNTVTSITDATCPINSSVKEIKILYSALEETFGGDVSLVFNKGGTRLDVMTVLVWYKPLSNNINNSPNESFFAKLSLIDVNDIIMDSIVFNIQEFNMANYGEWNLMVLSIQAAEDFDKVRLDFVSNYYDIKLNVYATLYKDSFTTLYRYDRDGKIDATLTGKEFRCYKLNELNQVTLSKNSVNSYDAKGNLIKSVDYKNNVIENEYDDRSNKLKTEMITKDGKRMKEEYSYENNEQLISEKNVINDILLYNYDDKKRIESIANNNKIARCNYCENDCEENGLVDKIDFILDEDGQQLILEDFNFEYQNQQLKKQFNNSNRSDNLKYEYEYYGDKKIKNVKYDDEIIYTCSYDTDNKKIKQYSYGNNQTIDVTYEKDNKNYLNKVTGIKENNELKYYFVYSNDSTGKPINYVNIDADLADLFIYRNNNYIGKEVKEHQEVTMFKEELKYNDYGNVFASKCNTQYNSINSECLNSSLALNKSLNGLEYELLSQNDENLFWTFMIPRSYQIDEKMYELPHSLISQNYVLLPLNYDDKSIQQIKSNSLNTIKRDLSVSSDKVPLSYKISENNTISTLLFRTKIENSNAETYLVSFHSLEKEGEQLIHEKRLEIYVKDNYFYVKNGMNGTYISFKTVSIPTDFFNNYHHIRIDLEKVTTEYDDEINVKLYIDGTKYIDKTCPIYGLFDKVVLFSNDDESIFHNFQLSYLLLKQNDLLSNEIEEKCIKTYDYLIEHQDSKEEFDLIIYSKDLPCNYVKFNHNFESNTHLKPSVFKNNSNCNSIIENFALVDGMVNNTSPGYAYALRNQKLEYCLPLNNSGMIGLRYKVNPNIESTLLHIYDVQNFEVKLFNSPGRGIVLKIAFREYILDNSLIEKWNDTIITWTKTISNDSLRNSIFKFSFYHNGSLINTYEINYFQDVDGVDVLIGRANNSSNDDFSIQGYIDMLLYSDINISATTAQNIHNQLIGSTYCLNKYDDFGRLKEQKVETDHNYDINTYCTYKTYEENNLIYETPIVEKEEKYVDGEQKIVQYDYEYYPNSNLKSLNKINYKNGTSSTERTTYTYTNKEQLFKEAGTRGTNTYYYDENGNITISNISTIAIRYRTFEYDKQKLLSFTDQSGNISQTYYFNYDGLYPVSLCDDNDMEVYEYQWEATKLKQFTNHKNNEIMKFYYDYSGKRIIKEKLIDNSLIEKTYYFYNSNDQLVIEEKYNYIDGLQPEVYDILYMYDSNGLLYGFKYNNNTYYYIRDSLGTINGICNADGEVVTNYITTAYGEHIVCDGDNNENTSINFIGNINPFRYKGYYYDVETQLYWVSSRYYSPELCRWISPDSIEYLDPESINGLNLYTYCGNDPVNMYDPFGHFAISTLIIGAIIGAVVGFGIAAYIDYQDDDEIFNGSVKWYDYLGTTVLGGAIGAGLGAFAGMSFSATLPTGFALAQTSAGTMALVATGSMTVTVTGAQILGAAGILSATYMFTKTIVDEGGVQITHNYPNDHGSPVHVHVSSDSGMTRVGPNGYPLNGDRVLSHTENKIFWRNIKKIRKVIKKLQKIIRRLPW